ncbi:MAG: hypothetical protein WC497_05685 [Patescibacteria group bacterium]
MSPRSFLRLLWLDAKKGLFYPVLDTCVVLRDMMRDACRRRKTAAHR